MAWGPISRPISSANFECGLNDWLDHSIGTVRASVECKNVPGLFGWLSAPRGRPRAYDLLVLTSATYIWFYLVQFGLILFPKQFGIGPAHVVRIDADRKSTRLNSSHLGIS